MTDLPSLLDPARLVDLTQPLGPRTTLWPGSDPFAATTVDDYEEDGNHSIGIVTLSGGPGHSDDAAVNRITLPAHD